MNRSGPSAVEVVTAYIRVWNERDAHARQLRCTDVLTPDVLYVDPNTTAAGIPAVERYIDGWQRQYPDMAFVLDEIRVHHHVAHFGWAFGPHKGEAVARGWDVVVLVQARISHVYGFFT